MDSKDLFLKNIGLKLMAIFLAVLLWFIEINTNNPIITKDINATLTLKNLSSISNRNLVLLNEEQLSKEVISVTLKGYRNDLMSFNNSDIEAYIDFTPIDLIKESDLGKETAVSVHVSKLKNSSKYEIINYRDSTVNIVVDKYLTENKKVQLHEIGTPFTNYMVTNPKIIDPKSIELKGAKSHFDSIDKVVVEVDITDAKEDVVTTSDVKVYDINNKNIANLFELSFDKVNVNIPIRKKSIIPIVPPKWIGEPKENYKLTEIIVDLDGVEVFGKEENILNLQSIELPDVNINNATGNVTKIYNLNTLLQGTGVTVENGFKDTVTATFKIEPIIEKIFIVPTTNF